MGKEILIEVASFVFKTVGKVVLNSVFGIFTAVWGLGKVIWKIWGLHKSIKKEGRIKEVEDKLAPRRIKEVLASVKYHMCYTTNKMYRALNAHLNAMSAISASLD
jgi:hypothetical protein